MILQAIKTLQNILLTSDMPLGPIISGILCFVVVKMWPHIRATLDALALSDRPRTISGDTQDIATIIHVHVKICMHV